MTARTLWLLTLPLLVVSETVGHALTTSLFDPDGRRHALFAGALESSLEYLHAAAGVFIALAAFVLVQRALASSRSSGPLPLPGWRLATIPSLAFVAQEHVEQVLQDGRLDPLTAAEPAVAAGMVVQLPCAVLVVWLARSLLRAADELGSRIAAARSTRPTRAEPAPQRCTQGVPFRLLALARGAAERAPPALA